jgi:hypothetical protein
MFMWLTFQVWIEQSTQYSGTALSERFRRLLQQDWKVFARYDNDLW